MAEKFNLPEILRDHGPQGLPVDEIAEKADIEPTKLGVVYLT